MTLTHDEHQEIASLTRRLDELGFTVVPNQRVQSYTANLVISPLEFWRRGRYWRANDPATQEAIRAKLAAALAMELLKRNAVIIERHRAKPLTLSLTGHLKVIFPEYLKHVLDLQAEPSR